MSGVLRADWRASRPLLQGPAQPGGCCWTVGRGRREHGTDGRATASGFSADPGRRLLPSWTRTRRARCCGSGRRAPTTSCSSATTTSGACLRRLLARAGGGPRTRCRSSRASCRRRCCRSSPVVFGTRISRSRWSSWHVSSGCTGARCSRPAERAGMPGPQAMISWCRLILAARSVGREREEDRSRTLLSRLVSGRAPRFGRCSAVTQGLSAAEVRESGASAVVEAFGRVAGARSGRAAEDLRCSSPPGSRVSTARSARMPTDYLELPA